jgi:hypothetical protein
MTVATQTLVALCMFVTGCTAVTTGSGPDGGAGGTGASVDGGAGTAAGGALNCVGILDCASSCADADTACADQCLARAKPTGKDAVVALSTCNTQNACADSACLQAKCASELQACLQSDTGGQPLPDGTAPATGSVPAELVGQWYSFGVLYEFLADGSASRSSNVSTGGCNSTSLEKGTAVVSGTTLTIYFTSGIFKLCGGSSHDPYKPTVEPFTYRVETSSVGVVLRLAKQDCQYTDPSSIGLYCTDGYDKK